MKATASTPRRSRWVGLLWLVVALVSIQCGNDSNTSAPTPAPRTSPVTETFQGTLPIQGSVWRLITAIQAGPLTATLSSTNQPSAEVGLALGLRSGNTCLVTRDVVAVAGTTPQLSLPVDSGDFCVKIWDAGALTSPLSFTVTISYP